MKREKEFKKYLEDNKIPIKNIGYCKNHIEKAFGGMDMDDIIIRHQNISKARAKLKLIDKNDACVDDYMVALNHYLKFAFEYGKMSMLTGASTSVAGTSSSGNGVNAYPSKIDVCKAPRVMYYDDVPFADREENLRRGLENEYPEILEFAKRIFGEDNGYIPVYLSKKTPPSRTYKVKKSFLNKLRKQNQKEIGDFEREILETGTIVTTIVAKFFPSEKPYIEIYYKNLPTQYKRLEVAINYLAHEYMHFMEFVYSVKNKVSAFADERVSEALADFFGVIYSINRGQKTDVSVAMNRYDLWRVLEGSGWPYAYALYFYCVNGNEMSFSSNYSDYIRHGFVNKLIDVFSNTHNPKDAYYKLINL
jgi:hypothetical protein